MKKIIYCSIFILIFFNSLNTLALDECTNDELKRLKELANNVEFQTKYEFASDLIIDSEDEKRVYIDYSINILNFSDDLKIVYKVNDSDPSYTLTSKENIIDNLAPKNKITFYIYSYINNLCTDELLKTKSITLKSYNDYYYFNKEECEKYPNFKYCEEFMDIEERSFDEIDELFSEYKKDMKKDDFKEIKDSSLYLIIGIILIILVIMIVVIKLVKNYKKKEEI
ncbi:MAG: hypothetical protein IJ501_00475 [Bacilli bacterium]|nr:hypothetical protein [Bacilli bacterium]